MPELARQAASILSKRPDVDEVWLFGSVARSRWDDDSDLDLLVVVEESKLPRYRRAQDALILLEEIKAPKDVIVLTRDEWDREMRAPASLASTVKREGICLHERGK